MIHSSIVYVALSITLIGLSGLYGHTYHPLASAYASQDFTASKQGTSNSLSPGMQEAANLLEEKQREAMERQSANFEKAENEYYKKFATPQHLTSQIIQVASRENQQLNVIKTHLTGNLQQAIAKISLDRKSALSELWAKVTIMAENTRKQLLVEREKITLEAGNFVLSKPLEKQNIAISYLVDLQIKQDLAKKAAQTKWIDDVISYEKSAIAQAMPKDSTLSLGKLAENERIAEEKMQLEILQARESAIRGAAIHE